MAKLQKNTEKCTKKPNRAAGASTRLRPRISKSRMLFGHSISLDFLILMVCSCGAIMRRHRTGRELPDEQQTKEV